MAGHSKRLLEGYRVLDLTENGYMFCGKLLAEMGAEVIAVEKTGRKPSRRIGPFYNGDADKENLKKGTFCGFLFVPTR